MSSTLYQLYRKKTFTLSKTLVIKWSLVVDAVNNALIELGHTVDLSQPTTWKYYKNIAGEYHFTDTMMTVVSVDTLETIEFTKENLQIHRATATEYQFGSLYYNDLVRRYPTQEMLIQSILNPVNIQTAINAEDGAVLRYDGTLVEENEYDLIPRIERWAKSFLVRWNVPAYAITEDLYVPTMLGIMYAQIPKLITNIRKDNCHTNKAHSYHIREFLASHGRLDVYMDKLTKKQALWLYRNIRYVNLNVGKQETFELLVENILTERGFPLASYEMRHNLANQPGELLPDVELVQRPINLQHLGGRNDSYSPFEVLSKQLPLAKNNIDVLAETEAYINVSMKHNAISDIPTKTLESSIVDLSDDGPFRLSDVLIQYWMYLSASGRYTALIPFTNPANGERLRVPALDAFIIFLYAYNRSVGVTLENIPTPEAIRVRRMPPPTFAELRAISEERYIPDSYIEETLADLPPIGVYINAEAFNDACEAIHARMVRHRYQYTSVDHLTGRGQAEAVSMHLYANIACTLSETENYADWFAEKGLDFSTLTPFDFDLMALEIIANATATDINASRSLRDLQDSMMRLMTQLSSYMVHYVSTINTAPFVVIDWSAIRTGDWLIKPSTDIFAPGMAPRVLQVNANYFSYVEYDLALKSEDYQVRMKLKEELEYSTQLGIVCTGLPSYQVPMDFGGLRVLDVQGESVN